MEEKGKGKGEGKGNVGIKGERRCVCVCVCMCVCVCARARAKTQEKSYGALFFVHSKEKSIQSASFLLEQAAGKRAGKNQIRG